MTENKIKKSQLDVPNQDHKSKSTQKMGHKNVNYILTQSPNKVHSIFGYDYDELKKTITLVGSDLHGSNISVRNFVKIICNVFKIKAQVTTINKTEMIKYYKFNPEKDIYLDYNINDLGKDINLISTFLKHKGLDVKSLQEKCLTELNTSFRPLLGIDDINLPPENLIKFNNGIIDIKTKEFFEKESDEYKQFVKTFDFINSYETDYLTEIDENNQYILVYNKLIKDLANNKEDQILLFNQLVFSVIEGNGRGKYIMLSGQAGSGKTTFGNILKHIAGPDYTNYLTLDMIDDDNSINTLSMSTRLILGDDLQKSAKLAGKALRYFKTLVDGNQLSVSVKYEPNRIVQTNGLWLQMMNDDPSIYEANDAIKDRTVLVKILGKNHRSISEPGEKEFSRRLDLYTGKRGKADENFIQAVVSYIIQHVEYFDEFTISDEMKENTNSMVDESNWAYQFVEWLNDMEFLSFGLLPTAHIQELLYHWIDNNNPSMKRPALRNINKELLPYLNKYNFSYDDKQFRFSTKNLIDYNKEIIEEDLPNMFKNLSKLDRTKIWINNKNIITKEQIDNFITEFESTNFADRDYDSLTLQEKLITKYSILYGNVDLHSWYLQVKN